MSKVKSVLAIVLLCGFISVLSSCHRGHGCPTFSIDMIEMDGGSTVLE